MEWETLGYIAYAAFLFIFPAVILCFVFRENIKRKIDQFRKAYLLQFNIFLVFAVVGVTLIALGIGQFMNNAVGQSFLWFALGGYLCWLSFRKIHDAFPPKKDKEPQNPVQENLMEQRPTLVKKRNIAILGCIGNAAVVAVVFFSIFQGKINTLNDYASTVLEKPIDKSGYKAVLQFEEDLKETGIAEKSFFRYKNAIDERKEQLQLYIQEYAKDIEKQIDALQPCTEIRSQSHHDTVYSSIVQAELSEADAFEAAVLKHVSNYDKLIVYRDDFLALRETYAVACSTCHGSGTLSCSSCGGSGRKVVKWYSEGDWGETSYSSYDCNACGGSGEKACHCGGKTRYVYKN